MFSKPYKILVIPSSNSGGVPYFRSVNPHEYLAKMYPDLFQVVIFDGFDKIPDIMAYLSQFSLVHMHKQFDGECKLISLLQSLNIPVVMDVDDNMFLGPDHPMHVSSIREGWSVPIIKHLILADAVTTTTPIFANAIKKYNKKVFVLPNAIDTTLEQFKPDYSETDRLRVGIICGSTHLKDIELLENMPKMLSQETLNKVQFVLCGFDIRGTRTIYYRDTGESKTVPMSPNESVWCDYEKIVTNDYKIVSKPFSDFLHKIVPNVEYPDLNESYRRCWTKPMDSYCTHYNNIDVLLAPLKENDFNKVKSQLKVVECGVKHKAIIAQDFGPYTIDLKSMVEKGGKINEEGNGLLVPSNKNHKLWAKYVEMLANNRDMLHKLQDNLHNYVMSKYELSIVSEQRKDLYLNLIAEAESKTKQK